MKTGVLVKASFLIYSLFFYLHRQHYGILNDDLCVNWMHIFAIHAVAFCLCRLIVAFMMI
ncbi:hypothetical protein JCM15457_718 [Liquorilactobacillus sucicola DSM 21376 = JCM 15457]|uniref:Uncharacterized protein n=1 Tax=Liquorilactobacillus sucicola DSM 21376 = JCM 15457 TaxID=1423806 RepID=A0A023CVA0_9LACO|nr:hypothetical protein FD15_GL001095 [Liquorilactobacillus sucicola DSM 21376 = JCM 15457]GAJ25818.1 hypothetical protein JCM15457_718 [Liquorilactobacillus sucicola DSM 21376 = JCM 15457]